MFYIIEQNGRHYKKKNAMEIKIADKEVIHDTKDVSPLNCVEMCL
jgi:hypothetical protein